MPKQLNIGLVGYGFMGRAHSNAYHRVNQFFDVAYQPVLKALAAPLDCSTGSKWTPSFRAI